MISWLQRTFQKHFKLVFFLLIAVMVIPMVFIYSASGGFGSPGGSRPQVEMFGQSLSSGQLTQLEHYAGLSASLSQNPLFADKYGRAALKHYADTLGIPQPTNEQLQEFIRTRPMFLGYDGQYNAQAYAQFRDNLRANLIGVSEADVQQVLREDWRLAQVEQALAGAGFVADSEVQRMFEEREAQWSVTTATLDLSTVNVEAEPTEDELRLWFEGHAFQYEIPEQVVVNYVEFTPANHLASIGEPTDDEIIAHFERNKARYQKPPTPNADGTTPAPTETTLADVREEVKNDVQQAKATAAAVRAASEFATVLYDNEILPDTPAFDAQLEKNQLTVKTAPAFARNEIASGLPWTPAITNAAFRLTEQQPVSDALRTREGGAVVLFFRGRNPSTQVTLDQVRDRVIADVKADKRRQAIVARGEELRQQLTEAVKSGKTFAEAAQAAGLETKSWEDFKLSSPPSDINAAVYQNLSAQKVHEVSQMAVQGERGTFVFVADRKTPDPATAQDTFAQIRRETMEQMAQLSAHVALSEIVKREKLAAGLSEDAR